MEYAVNVRNARVEDYPYLAELATQLGYPCKAEEVKARIESYIGKADKAIIVAETDGKVVGWASVEVVDHFYLAPFVEISGFVVDEAYRSTGIGAKIMGAAERWVGERGLAVLRLKTNVLRKDAHRFYEKLGFEKTKEQYVYVKKVR